MNLPTRIVGAAPEEAVISVDGAFGAPGLNLSHWPGNTTPAELRHDLSTGAALAFARLPAAERERLAAGAVAIVNNHYDTDGVCAVFATRHPEQALPRAERLLAAARAGDFFQLPDRDALALDALVQAFADPERSPLAADLQGLADHDRWSVAQNALLEELPGLLDGGLEPYRALWLPTVEAVEADLADLSAAEREEVPALDLTLWTAEEGAGSRRASSHGLFDPGRHALFGSTSSDRCLTVGPLAGGFTYRLVVSTLSWFDLVTETRLPRPDLVALARRLNALEETAPADELAWRAQPATNASPELWFGEAALDSFAEHNPALSPSELDPDRVLAEVERALGGDQRFE